LAMMILAFTASLCSCTSSTTTQPSDGDVAAIADFTSLLPPPSQVRSASWDPGDLIRRGYEFGSINHGVTAVDSSAEFAPNTTAVGLDRWAYAVYEFVLEDYTDPVSINLEWSGGAVPDNLWVGVSDWDRHCWEWYHAGGAASINIDPTTACIDAETYRLLVAPVYGGVDPQILEFLRIGEEPDAWVHTWGGSDEEFLNDIEVDEYGNIYFCGETWSYGEGDKSALVGKVTAGGTLDWAGVITMAGRQSAVGMCLNGTDLYVVGTHRDDGSWEDSMMICRMSTDGSLITSKAFGGTLTDTADAVMMCGGNLYVAGRTYNLEVGEPRSDCDTCLVWLDPALDAVLGAAQWGGTDYDSACSMAAPPDIAAAGGVVVVENVTENPDPWGNMSPRLTVYYDVTDTEHTALNLGEYPAFYFGSSVAGPGSDVFLAGYTDSLLPGSRDIAFVMRYDWASAPGSECVWGYRWYIGNEYSTARDIDFDGTYWYVAGCTGLDYFPDFTNYPLVMTGDADGISADGYSWGDGIEGMGAYAIKMVDGLGLALGGDALSAAGSWAKRAGTFESLLPERTTDAPSIRTMIDYSYWALGVTVTDIRTQLAPGEDIGAGLMDSMMVGFLQLGKVQQ